MLDSLTGERIIVKIHEKYGPYIKVSLYADAGALEDVLDGHYFVLYWTKPLDQSLGGGAEYFFGGGTDEAKIQQILDEISFRE